MPMTRERSDEGGGEGWVRDVWMARSNQGVQQRGWGGGRGMVMWQWGGDMCVCMQYGAARYACGG